MHDIWSNTFLSLNLWISFAHWDIWYIDIIKLFFLNSCYIEIYIANKSPIFSLTHSYGYQNSNNRFEWLYPQNSTHFPWPLSNMRRPNSIESWNSFHCHNLHIASFFLCYTLIYSVYLLWPHWTCNVLLNQLM